MDAVLRLGVVLHFCLSNNKQCRIAITQYGIVI